MTESVPVVPYRPVKGNERQNPSDAAPTP